MLGALAVALHTSGVAAQIPGHPYFFDPFRARPGVDRALVLTIGRASDRADQGFLSWAAGGRVRFADRVTVDGQAGLHYPEDALGDRAAKPQAGAAFNLLMHRRPRATTGLTLGGGYRAGPEGGTLVLPVGVGGWLFVGRITESGPRFGGIDEGGPPIGVWALPRGEVLHRFANGDSSTDLVFAVSVGVSAGASSGLGFNLAADYRRVPDVDAALSLPSVPEWSFAFRARLRR